MSNVQEATAKHFPEHGPIDPKTGKYRLSMRALQPKPEDYVEPAPRTRGPRRDGDRGPRRDGDRGPRRDGDRGPRRDGGNRGGGNRH